MCSAPMHQLNVIIGAHDIEDPRFQDVPPQYFSVSKVILHPNFRFSASHPDRYDIALIKLDKTVRFSDSVLPVCLPEESIQFEGWSVTSFTFLFTYTFSHKLFLLIDPF